MCMHMHTLVHVVNVRAPGLANAPYVCVLWDFICIHTCPISGKKAQYVSVS